MAATIPTLKNINQVGVVPMIKESKLFLHICGNELQRWVHHSPLDWPARISTSWCSCDDLVALHFQNHWFYPITTTGYSSFLQIIDFFSDYSSKLQIVVSRLSNAEVQASLAEIARPRTRKMCACELILFLGQDIPQSPPVNPDEFSTVPWSNLIAICNSYILYYRPLHLPTLWRLHSWQRPTSERLAMAKKRQNQNCVKSYWNCKIVHSMLYCLQRSWHAVKHDRGKWNGAHKYEHCVVFLWYEV